MGRVAALILVPSLSLGPFWLFASRKGWPGLTAEPTSRGRKVVIFVLTFFLLTGLVVIGAVIITLLPQTVVLDCGWQAPVSSQQYKGQTVFVAALHDPGIAAVKERFWGLPGGARRVLIAHWGIGHNELDGKTYLIDGRRANGLVTRLFPIVDVSHCSRSAPIDRAALDLRILREGPNQNGVHIVGQVVDKNNKPRPGTQIVITGPEGNIGATTDQQGIFDTTGLPPGQYSVRVEGCNESQNTPHNRCSDRRGSDLKSGDVWGVELRFLEARGG